MKKRILSFALAVFMLVSLLPVSARAAGSDIPCPFEGSGTEADPNRISGVEELAPLAGEVSYGSDFADTYYVQTADIGDEANPVTTVIGDDEHVFYGNFDGAGYTVTLEIYEPDVSNVGMFGRLGVGGEIKNLTAAGTVEGNQYVGGVCGYIDGGTVTGCTNLAAVTGSSETGAVCGKNQSGSFTDC